MADGEAVLEPFVAEVRERDAIWKAPPEKVPRLRVQKHRDGTITRILVRSNGQTEPEPVRAVTVWFSADEWALLERAVLAGLGLGKIE